MAVIAVVVAILTTLVIGGLSDVVTDEWTQRQALGFAVIAVVALPAGLVFLRRPRWRPALGAVSAIALGTLFAMGAVDLNDDSPPADPASDEPHGGCYFTENNDFLADACAND